MKKNQLLKLMLMYCLVYLASAIFNNSNAQVKIGVFADCQYCDDETEGKRYYQNSLLKLSNCITEFNENELDFVVGLGDLIDKDFSSFNDVNNILKDSKTKVHHVIGNHDLSVSSDKLNEVQKALNMKNTYYTLSKENWQFIFLNGNGISIHSTDPLTVSAAKNMLTELTANNQPNNNDWNGGLGEKQIKWLEKQLKKAKNKQKNVVIFCHYPLLPLEAHTLWDSHKVLPILKNYSCVKSWINGHNHAGNYVAEDGIHFVTMQGMVDTELENAYSTISFTNDKILIRGAGREKSRELEIK